MRQCKESANRVTPVWKVSVLALGVLLALRGEGAPMMLVGDAEMEGGTGVITDINGGGTTVELYVNTNVAGNLTATGAVEGTSITDGTATLTGGNLSGVGTIGSGAITSTGAVEGTSITDGTATLSGGNLTGMASVQSTALSIGDNKGTASAEFTVDNTGAVTANSLTTAGVVNSSSLTVGSNAGTATPEFLVSNTGVVTTTASVNSKTLSVGNSAGTAASEFTVSNTGAVVGASFSAGTAILSSAGLTGLSNLTVTNKIEADEITDGIVSIKDGAMTGLYSLTVDDLTVNNTMNIATQGDVEISSGNKVKFSAGDSGPDATTPYSEITLDDANGINIQVTNSARKPHGLTIGTSKTTLSGGENSTWLDLDDAGMQLRNSSGGPATLTGIADGKADNDAVNRKQLNTAYAGIASVAALAALPQPAPGRHFSLGVGTSYFQGESGVAMGMKGSLTDTTQFSLGGSYNSAGEGLVNGGIGMSW